MSLENDPDFLEEYSKIITDDAVKDLDDLDKDTDANEYDDEYLYQGIELEKGENDENRFAHVKKRAVDSDGKPIGKPNYDPRLDSRLYEIEYLDGNTEILSENTIAESLINDVDDESNKTSLLSEIIDHRRTQSVTRRKRKRGVTTKGWEFCVQWIDGSSNWVPLKDM